MDCVQIRGLDKLVRKLNDLGKNLDTVVDGALSMSAEEIRGKAVQNIQNMNVSYNGHTYDAKETMQLMGSLHVTRIGICSWAVGTPADHAPYVEFGTGSAGDPKVPHTTRPRWVYFSDAANGLRTAYPRPPCPYLLPAFTSHKRAVMQNIAEAIRKAAGG